MYFTTTFKNELISRLEINNMTILLLIELQIGLFIRRENVHSFFFLQIIHATKHL